jgi:hypothetical protein
MKQDNRPTSKMDTSKITAMGTTQTTHLTLWSTNMDTTSVLLTSLPLPTHQPTDQLIDRLRSTRSFNWTRTHRQTTVELHTLTVTLSKKHTFHEGKVSHNTDTLTTTDLTNWTTENTELREIHTLYVLLPDLVGRTSFLELSNTWTPTL